MSNGDRDPPLNALPSHEKTLSEFDRGVWELTGHMMVIYRNVFKPDVRGRSRGRASHLCGQRQLGCSWRQRNDPFVTSYGWVLSVQCLVFMVFKGRQKPIRLTLRWLPARRSQRKPWGRIWRDKVLRWSESECWAWWPALEERREDRLIYSLTNLDLLSPGWLRASTERVKDKSVNLDSSWSCHWK